MLASCNIAMRCELTCVPYYTIKFPRSYIIRGRENAWFLLQHAIFLCLIIQVDGLK